ncbi:hypothetical protein Tco_1387494 [Tanacetum coccineum]
MTVDNVRILAGQPWTCMVAAMANVAHLSCVGRCLISCVRGGSETSLANEHGNGRIEAILIVVVGDLSLKLNQSFFCLHNFFRHREDSLKIAYDVGCDIRLSFFALTVVGVRREVMTSVIDDALFDGILRTARQSCHICDYSPFGYIKENYVAVFTECALELAFTFSDSYYRLRTMVSVFEGLGK